MAGLKLKFKESKTSQNEKSMDSSFQSKKNDKGIPKPRLVGADSNEKKEQETQPLPRKKSNRYFYKVSNHHELFNIGSSFYEDYKKGVKSFAVGSTGYQTSQQNSILGLASFFDHKEDLKIAIVSDNLKDGAFRDIVTISKKMKMELCENDEPCEYRSFYGHFDFFDLDVLLSMSNNESTVSYEEVFDSLVDNYDLLFWDVPELEKIKKNSEKYFPVIMKFESLSIIVAQALSNSKDIKEVQSFFMGYGISLKGLLFDTKQKKVVEEAENALKRPWWRIFG